MKIEDVMSRNLIYSDINCNIYDVAEKMKIYDVGFILINDKNKIVGIITDRDIVVNNIYNKQEHIKDLITKNIITISKDKSLEDVAYIMKEKKIKRLIVTDNKKIIGVISLCDIIGKIDNDLFADTFKSIYEINRNDDKFNVDIDDFYL